MKIRIVVKPSKLKDSSLWHYDVEEMINSKWYMAYIFDDTGHHFYGGTAEDKDLAIELARAKAHRYIQDRKTKPHATRKKIVRDIAHIEEIKVNE